MFCPKCGRYVWWKYSFEIKSLMITGICECKHTIIFPINSKKRYTTFNPFKAMYLFLKYKFKKNKD